MLYEDHLDLNSGQFCSDSVRERMKQTMLNHELVLTGQIADLHRLYEVQIAMTEDAEKRGLDKHNSHAVGKSSPVNLNNQANCSMSGMQSCVPDLNQKAHDLHLSTDDFIRQSGNESSGSKAVRGFPIESNNSSKYTAIFDLNCPVNIAEDTDMRDVFRSPPEIIDLEDPNSIYSNNDVNLGLPCGLSSQTSCLKDKHKLETSILSDKHNLQIASHYRTGHVSRGTSSTLCETGSGGNSSAADKSVPQDLDPDSDEELCGSDGPKIESVGSTSKRSNDHSCEIDVAEAVVEAKPLMLSHSEVQDQRSSESPDSNIHSINRKEVEVGVDATMVEAAEALVQLSLGGKSKEQDMPRWSVDTHEAILRKAKECVPDDDHVSPRTVVVDVTEKDSRCKRERQRVHGKFKAVMASTSTFSRHEIREDPRTSKVQKPQNPKKARTGIVIEGDWCKQRRSKRPRISRKSYLSS